MLTSADWVEVSLLLVYACVVVLYGLMTVASVAFESEAERRAGGGVLVWLIILVFGLAVIACGVSIGALCVIEIEERTLARATAALVRGCL